MIFVILDWIEYLIDVLYKTNDIIFSLINFIPKVFRNRLIIFNFQLRNLLIQAIPPIR